MATPSQAASGCRITRARSSRGDLRLLVKMRAAHRVVVSDITLAHQHLKKIGLCVWRPEHLCARPQVRAPRPAKSLVEASRIERLHLRPVTVEPFRPRVERERVVATQILDVEHV